MSGSTSASPEAFRECMRLFPSGVAILSAGSGAQATAMVVNSVTSTSLEPPMMLVSVHRNARINAVLGHGSVFALGFLTQEQSSLTRVFAAPDRPVGTGVVQALGGIEGRRGVPLVAGAAGCVESELVETVVTGDHVLLIGRVTTVYRNEEDQPPQVFHHGRVTTVAPLQRPTPSGSPE